MTKRTFQPKAKKHSRVHGFLKRMVSATGRNVLKRRRNKGRVKITTIYQYFSLLNTTKPIFLTKKWAKFLTTPLFNHT